MDWNLIIEIGKVVGAAAVTLAAVWKIAPKIWSTIVGWMMHDLQIQIQEMSENITFIVSELKTNGGTSIKDSITRHEEILGRIETMSWNNVEIQRARMDNDSEMIFLTDKNGNCTWTNRSYTRLTGRNIQELKGSGWINVIHPEDRDRVKDAWYEAITDNREFEMRCKFRDNLNNTFEADIRSYRMSSADGKTTGYMGVGSLVVTND